MLHSNHGCRGGEACFCEKDGTGEGTPPLAGEKMRGARPECVERVGRASSRSGLLRGIADDQAQVDVEPGSSGGLRGCGRLPGARNSPANSSIFLSSSGSFARAFRIFSIP